MLDLMRRYLGLEWSEDPVLFEEPKPAGPLQSPGAGHVADLLGLAEIGYVEGIEAKLSDLENNPDNERLVTELRGHLSRFDFDTYRELLSGLEPHDG